MDELIANSPDKLREIRDAVASRISVSVHDFARLTGTPKSRVVQAVRDGRIPSDASAMVPVCEGIVALVSCGGLRDGGAIPRFLRDADAHARELLGLPVRDESALPDGEKTAALVEALKVKYLAAKTAASKAQGEKLKLETDIKQGKLVPRAEVEFDAATCATQVSSALMQLPARLAGMCAGQSAEDIMRIVRDEVRQIVRIIQTAAFTGDWSDVG